MVEILEEADLALVHALQIWPRASWATLAGALGASPTSVAARWEDLRDRRLAWVYGYPLAGVARRSRQVALVEVDCETSALEKVVLYLEQFPAVRSIEYSAQGRQLVLIVVAKDFASLSSFIVDEVGRVPGISAIRTHIGERMYIEGRQWRLDALSRDQREQITSARLGYEQSRYEAPVDLNASTYFPIVEALGIDGRASASVIAERIGRPASTVRRQLARLLIGGGLVMRCEVSPVHTGWPLGVTWWCSVRSGDLPAVVGKLRGESRVRLCLSLAGTANLVVNAWTRDPADLMDMQALLEVCVPSIKILDSSVTLRARKRAGWLLTADGRLDVNSNPQQLEMF